MDDMLVVESATPGTQEDPVGENEEEKDEDDEDFGDFTNGDEKPTDNGTDHVNGDSNSHDDDDDDDDDFGDFASPQNDDNKQQHDDTAVVYNNSDEDGGLWEAIERPVAQTTKDDDDDDDLGENIAGASVATSEAPTEVIDNTTTAPDAVHVVLPNNDNINNNEENVDDNLVVEDGNDEKIDNNHGLLQIPELIKDASPPEQDDLLLPSSTESANVQWNVLNSTDEFGDFGCAEPAAPSDLETTVDANKQGSAIQDQDDYLGFDSMGPVAAPGGDAFSQIDGPESNTQLHVEANGSNAGKPNVSKVDNDEDPFGALSSADAPLAPLSTSSITTTATTIVQDDPFGALIEATDPGETGTPVSNETDVFGAPCSVEDTAETAELAATVLKVEQNLNLAENTAETAAGNVMNTEGDLDSAQATAETAVGNVLDTEGNGFGTLSPEQAPDSSAMNEDDPFNVLSSAVAPIAAGPSDKPFVEVGSNDDDDEFGDFGDAAETPPETTFAEANGQMENTEDLSETMPAQTSEPISEDDDFGDFGSAGAPTGSFTVQTQNNDVDNVRGTEALAETVPVESNGTKSENEEDFGNFESTEAPSETMPSETVEPDDDFGDFDAAPGAKPLGENCDLKAAEDDFEDSFGDFGGASTPEAALESKTTDDSFGDFNTPAEATEDNTGDDNDFGDFGSAPSPAPAIRTSVTEDSFGDFNDVPANANDSAGDGDFDSAPTSSAAPPAEFDDDDFGNFSSFPESLPAPAAAAPASSNAQAASSQFTASFSTTSKPLLPVEENDPVLQKARNVFSKVFKGLSKEELTSEDGASDEALSVEGLLVRIFGFVLVS